MLYCPRCKQETRIALAALVAHYADEARMLESQVQGEGGKLLW